MPALHVELGEGSLPAETPSTAATGPDGKREAACSEPWP